jgi:predicted kinase/diadenosine tetraphosphatase ApaH/serine/threonine PP2A family protein phosphatase
MARVIEVPELSVIVLIGASGSGKSTFAREHFRASEILSSDAFRAAVADDESDQSVTQDAFEALYYIAAKRLRNARLCVIDATNVKPEDRAGYVELATRYHVAALAIVFSPNPEICLARNLARPHRQVAEQVVHTQIASLRRDLDNLHGEGFSQIHYLDPEMEAAVTIVRRPLACNKRQEHGPFDIIGDVHGCYEEMAELLQALGYRADTWSHPDGRKAVFVGDLADRGPRVLDSIQAVRNMVVSGNAFAVPGNHDLKFARWLSGETVTSAHGLNRSIADFQALPDALGESTAAAIVEFLTHLPSHYVFDGGKLVVSHTGLGADLQGRCSPTVREIAIFGKLVGGSYDPNWAESYRGRAMVVYGHFPIAEPAWVNGTINIDTGCVFGGRLTALRYPEGELVSVPARAVYDEFIQPVRL